MIDPIITEPVSLAATRMMQGASESVDLMAPWIVDDIRPLLAFLVPWFGLIGIIWAGERKTKFGKLLLSSLR